MTAALSPSLDSNISFARRSEAALSAGLLAVLVVLLVPLPSVLLDLLLAVNLGMTILLMLITLSAKKPLEVSVFPSLLLLTTLYRLSLNVATTRLILLDGDAGKIVATFGGFVVGGNLIVGLVIFLILIIIQFIVITKGAGRVSEVSARFTLDAMPGKQMAIDADLNSGSIDEATARSRRQQLAREAEFYGAMDGASKFVRGDAIAGLVITAVNLLGGVVLGLSNGMSVGEAVHRYSVLTIGDGLVSQIPALIIAVTAAILVTKAASEASLGQEIGSQMLANDRPLMIGAVILAIVALTPGLPKIPFLLISAGIFAFLQATKKKEAVKAATAAPTVEAKAAKRATEQDHIHDFLQTDRVCLEIGAGLIPLVESKTSKSLIDRIAVLRRDLTAKHGFWVPAVRIRDNMHLEQDAYRVLIGGKEVARDHIAPNQLLAINPGDAKLNLEGIDAKDPAFGLPAKWISPNNRARAELGGFTVVDAPTVVITHLGEILQRHAHELLSREDLQKLLTKLKESAPTVVEELKPDVLRTSVLHQVLILLLEERVPITDLARIVETAVNHAPQSKDPSLLAELIRKEIGRSICARFQDQQNRVRVVVLDPRLELGLRNHLREKDLILEPSQLERLIVRLGEEWKKHALQSQEVAMLTDAHLRRPLRRTLERALPDLPVISYSEIPRDLLIEPVAMIRSEDIFEKMVETQREFQPAGGIGNDLDSFRQEYAAA